MCGVCFGGYSGHREENPIGYESMTYVILSRANKSETKLLWDDEIQDLVWKNQSNK